MASAYRIKRAHRATVLNRQRRIAAGIIIFALIMAWFINGLIFSPVPTEAAEDNYVLVSVRSGDTLWSIAGKYNDGTDIRSLVHRIAVLNDIDDYLIREGEIIKVPR